MYAASIAFADPLHAPWHGLPSAGNSPEVPLARSVPSACRVRSSVNGGTPASAGGVTVVSHVPTKFCGCPASAADDIRIRMKMRERILVIMGLVSFLTLNFAVRVGRDPAESL